MSVLCQCSLVPSSFAPEAVSFHIPTTLNATLAEYSSKSRFWRSHDWSAVDTLSVLEAVPGEPAAVFGSAFCQTNAEITELAAAKSAEASAD